MNNLSHIAIIMDGNGRWAIQKNKNREYGHRKGLENIKSIIIHCINNRIKYLSLFAFSFDNWKRSKKEISNIFLLLENFLKNDLEFLKKNKIKVRIIGENKNLKKKLIKTFKRIEDQTKDNSEIIVNIAFNYNSKLEILNGIRKLIKKKIKKITTSIIDNFLYTCGVPDPEILIRTGGHNRISNFMLWQISYTEIFFIKKLWPDFSYNDLNKIISKYKKIKRNFGSINE